MNTPYAIAILWMVYLIAMFAHMSVALLPLFSGRDVSDEAMKAKPVEKDKWMLVILTVVPMLMIGGTLMFSAPVFCWMNFSLSIILSLLNCLHLLQHVRKNPPDHSQNLLLMTIVLLSLQLNYFSYVWIFEN